jgi:hypothetical protein
MKRSAEWWVTKQIGNFWISRLRLWSLEIISTEIKRRSIFCFSFLFISFLLRFFLFLLTVMGPTFADLRRSFYRLVVRKCLDLQRRFLFHILLLSGSNAVETYLQRSPVISAMYFVKAGGREKWQPLLLYCLNVKAHNHRHFELWISV